MESDPAEITQLLQQWADGDGRALDQMMPMVYRQLRALAQNQMRRERGGHTLQATALVNELYMRLAKQYGGQWNNRGHFFAFAAMLMGRILTDHAKHVHREKRGGSQERVPLSEDVPWLGSSSEEILALSLAMDGLERQDERKARVIELRVFLGCSPEDRARILEISKATADREWTLAKAWLFRELKGNAGKQAGERILPRWTGQT